MRRLAIFFLLCSPAFGVYGFVRSITIDHTKVPNTDQTNFPVLITGTYSYLKTVGNGGNVQSSSGFDIVYTSDTGCTTLLNFERAVWGASTGVVVFWVQVGTVSHSVDTVFYECYGNSSISSDQQNQHGTWDANYWSVIHTKQTTGTYSASDLAESTATSGTMTIINTLNGGAGPYNGSINYPGGTANFATLSTGYTGMPSGSHAMTVECWVKRSSGSNEEVYGIGNNSGGSKRLAIFWDGAKVVAETGSGSPGATFSLNDGVWHHIAVVNPTGNSNNSGLLIYVDGVSLSTSGGSGTLAVAANSDYAIFTIPGAHNVDNWTGSSAEHRVSSIDRSADWLVTEFNNGNSPSTFYTVSAPLVTAVPAVFNSLIVL